MVDVHWVSRELRALDDELAEAVELPPVDSVIRQAGRTARASTAAAARCRGRSGSRRGRREARMLAPSLPRGACRRDAGARGVGHKPWRVRGMDGQLLGLRPWWTGWCGSTAR